MYEFAVSLTPTRLFSLSHLGSNHTYRALQYLHNRSKSSIPICRIAHGGNSDLLPHPSLPFSTIHRNHNKNRRNYRMVVKSKRRESPYEVLGVSPSATANEIKKAYRKLALKYHPDVNKEENAQDKFMRIKHAYSTLLNSESRKRYESGDHTSDYSYSTAGRNQSRNTEDEEEFYGFEDFFRDLQTEYKNWEASAASQGTPKSLLEELAEIGEEFVEFLEKELKITDAEVEAEKYEDNAFRDYGTERNRSGSQTEAAKKSSIEEDIDEIEATLAKLKKELNL